MDCDATLLIVLVPKAIELRVVDAILRCGGISSGRVQAKEERRAFAFHVRKRKEKPAPKVKVKISEVDQKKLKSQLDIAEKEVERLTKEITKYNKALNNPKLYDKSNPTAKKALQQFTREKAILKANLEKAEEFWLSLEEKQSQ